MVSTVSPDAVNPDIAIKVPPKIVSGADATYAKVPWKEPPISVENCQSPEPKVESGSPPVESPPPCPEPVLSCTFTVKLQVVLSKPIVKVVGVGRMAAPKGLR